jgi:hypothetical protein
MEPMKRGYFYVWAGAAVAAGAMVVVAPVAFAVSAVVAAGGWVLYKFSRCRHGGPLGLLPPTVNPDGTRTPAQWYCDSCGRSWPVGLEHDRTPVVRFAGYDQTKLPAAARRAAALDKQRQSLAVRRAGLAMPRVESRSAANVTPISQRRAAR